MFDRTGRKPDLGGRKTITLHPATRWEDGVQRTGVRISIQPDGATTQMTWVMSLVGVDIPAFTGTLQVHQESGGEVVILYFIRPEDEGQLSYYPEVTTMLERLLGTAYPGATIKTRRQTVYEY